MVCSLSAGMLLFGVVFLAGYLFSTLSQSRNAMDHRNALQAFIFVIFGIYFVWFWAKGQTLAMKTWHLRLVSAQGGPLTPKQALARYMTSWLWFVPALAAAWLLGWHQSKLLYGALFAWILIYALISALLPKHQFAHDTLCGTRLIDNRG